MLVTGTPVQSLVGGLGLAVSIHALFILNRSRFGVSGLFRKFLRGERQGVATVFGLVLGGIFAGLAERGDDATSTQLGLGAGTNAGAAFLVGLGSKLANGCTSGHMLVGISRLSPRSIVATFIFILSGSATTLLLHADTLSHLPSPPTDWSFGPIPQSLLFLQSIPLLLSLGLHTLHNSKTPSHQLLSQLTTSLQFALALRLSNLTDPTRVLQFLATPFSSTIAFDASLAWLAAGALPVGMGLHWFWGGDDMTTTSKTMTSTDTISCARPHVGTNERLNQSEVRPLRIDGRLVLGAVLFGIGWGAGGVCPGPALVNLGRALAHGKHRLEEVKQITAWLFWFAVGGCVSV